MSQPVPPEEERFSSNVTVMAKAVADGVSQIRAKGYDTVDPTVINLAVAVISGFDKHYLIQGFIENSHQQCWDKIKARDEIYFMEHVHEVFQYLPMEHVNMFADLFRVKDANGQSVVPQSLKDQIWGLFDAMIKICIKYIHKQRGPYSEVNEGEIEQYYQNEFSQQVDLVYHAGVWNVQLDFPMSV